ncbi:DUF4401 domain-containing protein [Zunongwangia sp.]|uniref:DUF4401 domain-containing protein n=1 Tax=Zunongwangia sp. TaxID=1965325 RepID=UPI003AA843F9
MEKLTNKKLLLDKIRFSEGSEFECDENAILEEYANLAENKSSLAIKILSIFGGFLATLALIGFYILSGLYDSEYSLLIFGTVFLILAICLNKWYDKIIIDTFSISIYIAGFILYSLGLSEIGINENIISLSISCIALSCLFICQNYILSFISIITISGSFLFLIAFNNYYNLVHLYIAITSIILVYVFLNEAKIISSHKKLSKLYNPIRIGMIFSLLFGLIGITEKRLLPISLNYIWLSSIIIISVIMYLTNMIIKINEITSVKTKSIVYILTISILAPTIFSPTISGAIAIILLSFLVNYKSGVVIGILAFIYFISQYYYSLNFTLLSKSIILFVSGIIFLLFYLFIIKKLNSNEKI